MVFSQKWQRGGTKGASPSPFYLEKGSHSLFNNTSKGRTPLAHPPSLPTCKGFGITCMIFSYIRGTFPYFLTKGKLGGHMPTLASPRGDEIPKEILFRTPRSSTWKTKYLTIFFRILTCIGGLDVKCFSIGPLQGQPMESPSMTIKIHPPPLATPTFIPWSLLPCAWELFLSLLPPLVFSPSPSWHLGSSSSSSILTRSRGSWTPNTPAEAKEEAWRSSVIM